MSPLPPKPLSTAKEFYRYLVDALKALDVRLLVNGKLVDNDGVVCALGAMVRYGGFSEEEVRNSPGDYTLAFPTLWTKDVQREISATYGANDGTFGETPSQRYARMLAWATERAGAGSRKAIVTATDVYGPYSEDDNDGALDAQKAVLEFQNTHYAVIDLSDAVVNALAGLKA